MTAHELFAAGLKLESPWYIEKVHLEEYEDERGVLHIYIDHKKRSKFKYGSKHYPVYDHQNRMWQHLNFFEYKCLLYARVPRIKDEEGKVKLVDVPWAHKGSSFSLKFEQDVLELIRYNMSAKDVGLRYKISGKTVFRIIQRHVSYALATQDIEPVKELSVDETSSKRGHNYLTILADRNRKKVVGVAVGKDKEAFAHALVDMEVRGAERTQVRSITMDMSRSYISAANETMAQADIVFDRFHIAKQMNEAVDQIRRADQQEYGELKRSRYLWLRNSKKLNNNQKERLEDLAKSCSNIGTAYQLKEQLKLIMDEAYYSKKLTPLNDWMKVAWRSGLEPIQDFVNMLKKHWYGIQGYFKRVATNAYAERVNLKIQEIKRLARGYRNINNFILMIYFHLGGLDLKPTKFD